MDWDLYFASVLIFGFYISVLGFILECYKIHRPYVMAGFLGMRMLSCDVKEYQANKKIKALTEQVEALKK